MSKITPTNVLSLHETRLISIQACNEAYLSLFYQFLSSELVVSLKMPHEDTARVMYGRNISIIVQLLKTFNWLALANDKAKDSTSVPSHPMKQAIINLKDAISLYIEENKKHNGDCLIDALTANNQLDKETEIIKKVSTVFVKYYKTYRLYKNFDEELARLIHNKTLYSLGCIQAILEFFNALSHTLAYCIGKLDANVTKANEHLYRGALDNLKAIIKSTHAQYPDMVHCNNPDDVNRKNLITIRKTEFQHLGVDSQNTDKHETIEQLYQICEEIVVLLKSKSYEPKEALTRTQKRAIVKCSEQLATVCPEILGNLIPDIIKWDIEKEEQYYLNIHNALASYIFIKTHLGAYVIKYNFLEWLLNLPQDKFNTILDNVRLRNINQLQNIINNTSS